MTTTPFSAMDERLVVEPCGHDAARYAVMRWHYSRSMPNGKLVKFGVWEHGRFVGAVLFGRGASPRLLVAYGLDAVEGCELVRVALDAHEAPVTEVVARALRLVHRLNPCLRLVVSFADEREGHVGTIYQAGNWLYLGESVAAWYRVGGVLMHGKTLHTRYGAGGQSIPWLRANVDPNAERVPMPVKHRYVMPLDRAMRRRLAPLARPYPRHG